jgi:membrane-associated HD superfamily phosphohydrolase
MLADTVEAASRSLEKPTPNRIAEMVETLMRDKLLDGQLDLCPLTLEDLHAIRESFVFSLSNILHGRSPYPREDQPAQPSAGAAGAAGGAPAAGPGAGAPGVST